MATRLSDSAVFHGQSFQDMIAPLKEYSAAYKEVEQAYDTVSQSTAGIRDLISPERDSATYERYMNYANRLNETVDDFAKGMSMGNRAALLGLKRDYASEIVPINTAITKRNTLADEQREMRLKNPTAIFQRDANTISLDRFIENPQTDYGGVIYGSVITEQARNMMKNLAKEIHDNPNNPRLKKLFPYTYSVITDKGYNSGTIYDYLMNGADDDKRKNILNEIIKNVVSSSGVEGWNDPNATQQVWDYAAQSVWDSIGEPWARDVYDKYSSAVALAGLSGGSGSGTTTQEEQKKLALDKRVIYSTEEKNARDLITKNLQDLLNKDYLARNDETGDLYFTKKGLEQVSKEQKILTGSDVGFMQDIFGIDRYSPVLKLYNAVQSAKGKSDVERMSNYLQSIGYTNSGEELKYDFNDPFNINRAISYGMNIRSTNSDNWLHAIARAKGDEDLYYAKYNKETGKYEKGDDFDKWDSIAEGGHIQSVEIAPGAIIANLQDKELNNYVIILPKGTIGENRYDAIMEAMEEKDEIVRSVQKNQGNFSEEELAKRKNQYESLVQGMSEKLIGSMIVNETTPQKSEVSL